MTDKILFWAENLYETAIQNILLMMSSWKLGVSTISCRIYSWKLKRYEVQYVYLYYIVKNIINFNRLYYTSGKLKLIDLYIMKN